MKKDELSFYDLFYTFIFGCFFGWLVEGLWSYFKKGLLINHSALVLGPMNIVYGFGSLALTTMLYKLKKQDVIKIFISSFITGTILEYVLSFLMEKMVGFVAWNYSSKFMNINGRVCLVYSIFWGILGVVWIKLIYPKIKELIDKSNHELGTKFMKFLIIFLVFDTALTFAAVDRGKKAQEGIEPKNVVEEKLDQYFGVDYLDNMYNYRWNKK